MNNRTEANSPDSASRENEASSRRNRATKIFNVLMIVAGIIITGLILSLIAYLLLAVALFPLTLTIGVLLVCALPIAMGAFVIGPRMVAAVNNDDQTVTSSTHLITKTTGYGYGSSYSKSLAEASETEKPSVFNKLSNKVSAVFNSLFSKGDSKNRAEARDDLESSKLKL